MKKKTQTVKQVEKADPHAKARDMIEIMAAIAAVRLRLTSRVVTMDDCGELLESDSLKLRGHFQDASRSLGEALQAITAAESFLFGLYTQPDSDAREWLSEPWPEWG